MKILRKFWPFAVILAFILFAFWKVRLPYVVDRVASPNRQYIATVFEVEMDSSREEGMVPAVSVEFNWPFPGGSSSFLCTAYEGLYWSPDSTMYLLEMAPLDEHGIALELCNLVTNSGTLMSNSVAGHMKYTPLADYGFRLNESEDPIVDLTFLQWASDSSSIQLRYSFTDTSGADHCGTFWFNLVWDDWFLDKSAPHITDILEDF